MREQRKIEAGKWLLSNATACLPHIVEGCNDDSDDCDSPQCKHAKRPTRYNQVVNCKLDRFTAIFKQSYADQLRIERDRLAFEREQIEQETRRYHEERKDRRAEAEKNRAEQKEERKSRDRMKLGKFEVTVEVLRQSK